MNGMFQPDMRLWSQVVVINWVKSLDPMFSEYLHLFVKYEISGDRLVTMTHDDLIRIGIDKVGPQAILLEAVDAVKKLSPACMESDTLQLHIYQLSVAANCLVQSIQAYITLLNQIDSNPMERALYEHDRGRYQLDFFCALVELVEAGKEAISWLCRVPFYTSLDTEATRLLHSIQQSVGSIVCAFQNYSDTHQGKVLQDIKEQSLKLTTTSEKYVTGFKDPLAVVPCQLDLVHIKRNPGDSKWGITLLTLNNSLATHVISEVSAESAASGNQIQKGDEVLAVADQPVVCLPHQCVSGLIEATPGALQLVLRKRPCYSESRQSKGRKRPSRSSKRSSQKKKTQAEAAAAAAAAAAVAASAAAAAAAMIVSPKAKVVSPRSPGVFVVRDRGDVAGGVGCGGAGMFVGDSIRSAVVGDAVVMETHDERDESALCLDDISGRPSSRQQQQQQPPQITLTEAAAAVEPRRPKFSSVSSLPDHQQGHPSPHQQQQHLPHVAPAGASPSRSRKMSNGGGTPTRQPQQPLAPHTPPQQASRTSSREDPRGSCVNDDSGGCHGWLFMKKPRSPMLPANWIRRYCVLRNHAFYYYKTENIQEEHAEGLINMPHLFVTFMESERGPKFSFHIENRAVETTFTFATESDSNRRKWVNMLALATIGYQVSENQRIAGFEPPFLQPHPPPHQQQQQPLPQLPAQHPPPPHPTATLAEPEDADLPAASLAAATAAASSLPPPVPPRLSRVVGGAAASPPVARHSPMTPRREPPPTPSAPASVAAAAPFRPLTQILEGACAHDDPGIPSGPGAPACSGGGACGLTRRESDFLRKVMKVKRLEREIQDKKEQLALIGQFLSSEVTPDTVSEFLHRNASALGINRFLLLTPTPSSGTSLSSDSSTVI